MYSDATYSFLIIIVLCYSFIYPTLATPLSLTVLLCTLIFIFFVINNDIDNNVLQFVRDKNAV